MSDSSCISFNALHGQPLHPSSCEVAYFSEDCRQLLTAGSDGRLYSTDVSDEAPQKMWGARIFERMKENTAVAVSSDATWLAFGQEYEGGFGIWACPLDASKGASLTRIKLVARTTLPVRHLSWHQSSPLLGAATDDGRVIVWDARKGSRQDYLDAPSASGGGVRCVALDPRGEFVAAALASGDLVVKPLKHSAGGAFKGRMWPKTVIGAERLHMAWRPDGEVLALTGFIDVKLMTRGQYKFASATLIGGHRQVTTTAAWTRTGDSRALLATASCDSIVVWLPPLQLRVYKPGVEPCSLAWGGTALAVGTASGSWARLKSIAIPHQSSLEEEAAVEEACSAPSDSPGAEASTDQPSSLQPTAGDAGVTLTMPTTSDTANPVDLAGQSDAEREGKLCSNDDSAKEVTPGPIRPMVKGVLSVDAKRQLFPELVTAFQPGASCRANGKRYLMWNEHGTLIYHPADHAPAGPLQKRSIIERAKLSKSVGRIQVENCLSPMDFDAPHHLALGAIGPSACALATCDPDNVAAVIVYVGDAESFSAPRCQHDLPAGETVEALAVGRDFFAALTSKRLLRIHSLSGILLGVFSLAGDPVCLVAFEELLFVVTREEDHAFEYDLYSVAAQRRISGGPLPLSPDCSGDASRLRWVGFSPEAIPLVLDSAGLLRALIYGSTGPAVMTTEQWVPVAELEKKGASMWPVQVHSSALRCIEVSKDWEDPPVGSHSFCDLREIKLRLPIMHGVASKIIGDDNDEADAKIDRILLERLMAMHQYAMMELECKSGASSTSVLDAQLRSTLLDSADEAATVADDEAVQLFEAVADRNEPDHALAFLQTYLSGIPLNGDARTRIHALHEVADELGLLSRPKWASVKAFLQRTADEAQNFEDLFDEGKAASDDNAQCKGGEGLAESEAGPEASRGQRRSLKEALGEDGETFMTPPKVARTSEGLQ